MRGRAAQARQARAAFGTRALRGRSLAAEENRLRVAHLALGFAFDAIGEEGIGHFMFSTAGEN